MKFLTAIGATGNHRVIRPFLFLFLAVFYPVCICRASHPTPGQVCSLLFTRVKDSRSRVILNESKRKAWVKLQPKIYRPFFDLISSQIHIISREEFFKAVDESVAKFLLTLKADDDVLFVYDEFYDRFKSGQWVIGYIREVYPDLKKFPVERAYVQAVGKIISPRTRIVYVDDALFSATNASGSLSAIVKSFPLHRSTEVLVPYVTNRARARMAEKVPDAISYFARPLRTLKEKLGPTKLRVPPVFIDAWWEAPIEMIDHLIPDYHSFLEFLASGMVLRSDGLGFLKEVSLPFLESSGPPYRSVDRFELDPAAKERVEQLK
jgi:hypothetical protein